MHITLNTSTMKNILLFIGFMIVFTAGAQTTCQTAQPFCAGGVSGVTFPATTGTVVAQPGPNYGCLGSVPNPAWYYLQINTSGNLDILIQGVATNPVGPGQDVDFICWGPFNSLAGICNSLTAGNTIDCSYSGSFTETLNIPSGITGQYYLVLITNFANVAQNILFSQFGGTGDTNCGLVTTNTAICMGSSATLSITPPTGLSSVVYTLFPGNISSNTSSFVVSPSVTTNYSILATGVNSLNISLTQSATSNVTVNPIPLAAPTITNTTCTNTLNALNIGLTFSPANPAPGYTITWSSIPNGITNPLQTSASGSIAPGVYVASITAAGGCKTVANFTIIPKPQSADFTLTPAGTVFSITCYNPILTIDATNPVNTYTWSNGLIAPIYSSVAVINNNGVGNWTVSSLNPSSGCVANKTFVVAQNTAIPLSTVSPPFQNITCTFTSITTVTLTASPTVNIEQSVTSAFGGSFVSNAFTTGYLPGAAGLYTYCVTNLVNGCSICKVFTVTSTQGYPTFNTASPQNFTLGCGTKSVAVVNILNGNTTPSGGPVSYGILAPGATTPVTTGGSSTFTVSTPGTYTLVTMDMLSQCQSRVPVSIISNTLGPKLDSVSVPKNILDCNTPSIILKGNSGETNVDYTWSYPGVAGNLPSQTITINTNTLTPTNTLIANYTLTMENPVNTCVTKTIVPMYQNLYPPIPKISSSAPAITCKTQSLTLTNISSQGLPANSSFIPGVPVGYVWDGPSPQARLQVNSTYVALTVGFYTLTVKDSNNGCTSQTVISIADGKIYPSVNVPQPPTETLDCGAADVPLTPVINNSKSDLTYLWQLPVLVPSSDIKLATLRATTLGLYKVLVTNTLNGCSTIGSMSVTGGSLKANIEADRLFGFAPFAVKFNNLTASSTGSTGVKTVWNFGNGTYSVTESASITPECVFRQAGTYKVLIYSIKGTCLDTISKTIVVDIPSKLEVPNVFTPNGDGVNDVYFLKTSNLAEIKIKILDRWGNKVYELFSTSGNIAWDGKNQTGDDLPQGNYFYSLKATGTNGASFEKEGTITLLR
jgi:gliding motility-associated-like protein